MADVDVSRIALAAERAVESSFARLDRYLTFAPISSEPDAPKTVGALAEALRADLEKLGLEQARVLALPDALPCVAAEWTKAGPGAPTVLIYGHFDVQPVKNEVWTTEPHRVVRKGDRIYGRGSADDMGGWLSHLVAIEAWLAETGGLPCNLKLLLEGEEEIGSPNLERFMDAYPDAFASDAMVLTDCENPSVDIPGLSVSLRGLLEVEVTIESAKSDVHSGIWGNLVPDPAMALVTVLARLVDEDGRLRFGRRDVDAGWLERSRDVPLTPDVIRSGARLLDGVAPLPDRSLSPAAWVWRQPAVTILSTTFPAPGTEKNAIRKSASAKLSFRIAPGQTSDELFDLVMKELTRDVPAGLAVTLAKQPGSASSWDYVAAGPAFEAADRAYEKAWGRAPLRVGLGGSIPFVALFGRRFATLPLVLNGVIDPDTGAHGPNESMHVGVYTKTVKANVHLYAELARALTK
ncbi:MAG: M20/M25/M40 family metallo-hydrolase [Labilithrix sp.]|nr:M20/M25/M40 family metallo-hydrolase [Labilithrix sp.]MCW5817210.1 M20/M25/M40 family metallo-hydrolase [Labilithrix sp.]